MIDIDSGIEMLQLTSNTISQAHGESALQEEVIAPIESSEFGPRHSDQFLSPIQAH